MEYAKVGVVSFFTVYGNINIKKRNVQALTSRSRYLVWSCQLFGGVVGGETSADNLNALFLSTQLWEPNGIKLTITVSSSEWLIATRQSKVLWLQESKKMLKIRAFFWVLFCLICYRLRADHRLLCRQSCAISCNLFPNLHQIQLLF